ncbi:carbohydrate ABC transporter permease [Streptomyces sp. NBC_01236]|uniref:carbohydrate ABC transporter permease n=1 Tax=Streptomyces sp. NBC_01236 TaxID=2903789 RepID=UPI002E15896C|nr:carbohydrate ABC transporter permease [Streptomyces sp. NBC_01236]
MKTSSHPTRTATSLPRPAAHQEHDQVRGPATRPTRRRIKNVGAHAATGATHALLVFWALLATVPLLWALISAFKDNRELFGNPWQLPSTWHADNFARAWSRASIGDYFVNTLIVVFGSLLLTMILGSMVAYVLARFTFPGCRLIYYAFVAGMAFPVVLALVPLFFVVKNLGLLGSYHGMILVYTAYALPFTVFFLTSFFRTLPTAVAEAALIDGASQEAIFFRIMLPMAKPGLLSVGIFNFLGMWNQYLLPVALNSDRDKYVLSQGLANLASQQGYEADWSALFAGLVIAAVPVIGLYLVLQRRIQAGLTVGMLK